MAVFPVLYYNNKTHFTSILFRSLHFVNEYRVVNVRHIRISPLLFSSGFTPWRGLSTSTTDLVDDTSATPLRRSDAAMSRTLDGCRTNSRQISYVTSATPHRCSDESMIQTSRWQVLGRCPVDNNSWFLARTTSSLEQRLHSTSMCNELSFKFKQDQFLGQSQSYR